MSRGTRERARMLLQPRPLNTWTADSARCVFATEENLRHLAALDRFDIDHPVLVCHPRSFGFGTAEKGDEFHYVHSEVGEAADQSGLTHEKREGL